MRSRDSSILNFLSPVFAGADADLFTLPDEVIGARALVTALDAMHIVSPDVEAAREEVRSAIVDAARSGRPMPDAKAVVVAEIAQREADAAWILLGEARQRAAIDLEHVVEDLTDVIITDHLRPAHDQALTNARKGVATITKLGIDPLAMLKTDDALLSHVDVKVRGARTTLAEASRRYSATRAARGRLVERFTPLEFDTEARFAFCRNTLDLWPGVGSNMAGAPPWPTDDPLAHIVWLVTNNVDAWMPTASEQDAYFRAVYADNLARMSNARAFSGMTGVPVMVSPSSDGPNAA